MIKSKRGITLIALVVTIIVLLLLAGISITMLTGQNGILNRAGEAKEATGVADVQERIKLATMEALTNGIGTITKANLESSLTSEFGSDYKGLKEHKEGDVVDYWTTEIKGTTAKIYTSGEIKYKRWQYKKDANDRKTIITDGKIELKLGDYINYSTTAGVTDLESLKYTSPVGTEHTSGNKRATESVTPGNGYSNQEFNAANYSGKWRVLGLDEEKDEILIMNEDIIITTENSTLGLRGITGIRYGINELNNISKIYGKGKGATGARSIKVEDINKITGYNPKNTGVYDPEQTGTGNIYGQGNLYEYGNEVTYKWESDDEDHLHYKGKMAGGEGKTTYYSYKDYGFNWIDEKLVGHSIANNNTEEKAVLTSNNYFYYAKTLTTDSTGTPKGIATDSEEYKMLFKNSSNSDKQYRLASFEVKCRNSVK